MINNKIKFYSAYNSIQGEGPFVGNNSVFMKLGGCNLKCGLIKKDISIWKCDTEKQWKFYDKITIEKLKEIFEKKGLFNSLKNGSNLVITGGEPLLQQNNLVPFLKYVRENYKIAIFIETNGTIKPKEKFDKFINFYIVSPKLYNSDQQLNIRIKEKALKIFADNKKSLFNFVVCDIDDIKEIKSLAEKFKIANRDIYLMPISDDKNMLAKYQEFVWRLAIENGYNYSHRLNIQIFDTKIEE